jgi:hypothetical protein
MAGDASRIRRGEHAAESSWEADMTTNQALLESAKGGW